MPDTTKTASSARTDPRLSRLIQLKRLERPDAAFWKSFEQEFRSRQLTTFVRTQPLHTRLRKAILILARKAAPPIAAAGAITLTFFAVSNTSYLLSSDSEAVPAPAKDLKPQKGPSEEQNYFVVQSETYGSDPAKALRTDEGTIYQVNLLETRSLTEGYQLNANPVTFSNGAFEQPYGAKVIRAQPDL